MRDLDNLDPPFYMLKLFRTSRIPLLSSKTGINRGRHYFFFFAPKQDFGYPLEPSLIAVFTSTHNLSLEQNEKNVAFFFIWKLAFYSR